MWEQTVTIPAAGAYRLEYWTPHATVTGSVNFRISVSGGVGCPPLSATESQLCNPAQPHAGDNQPIDADPILSASGSCRETMTDVVVAGRSEFALAVRRTYSSLYADTDGPFGFGWNWNWGVRLQLGTPQSGMVRVVQESGATADFYPVGATSFVATPRVTARLAKAGDGTFTLTRDGGQILHFLADGRLDWVKDRWGYQTSLSYGAGDRLSAVTEDARAGGRSLTVGWRQDGGVWRIGSVTDPANRTVTYG